MQRVENLLFIFFGEDSETTGIRVTPCCGDIKAGRELCAVRVRHHQRHFARAGSRCVYRKGLPIEQNGPSLRRKLRGKRFHQGRFTRAVRADKRQNLSALGGEFDMLQKRRIVADRKVVRFTIAHAAASLLCLRTSSKITTGAPKIAVTELTESSVGANILRAMRSHKRQNAAPPKTHPGSTCKGFALRSVRFTRCGTAMPTKEIGPANAVTHAASRLDNNTSATENGRTETPTA